LSTFTGTITPPRGLISISLLAGDFSPMLMQAEKPSGARLCAKRQPQRVHIAAAGLRQSRVPFLNR